MGFPFPAQERALHQRLLAGDPVAPVDVFQAMMGPMIAALRGDLGCTEDEAHDSAIDGLLVYLDQPGRYDPARARLSTYVMDISKKKAIDRLRSRIAAEHREGAYAGVVELQATNPNDMMEVTIEARELWQMVEKTVEDETDRRLLKLVLSGERTTEAFAQLLGISHLTLLDQRRVVKQHRDRLMKVLERLRARLNNDDKA
jgi:RNA polymerase sigma-70 factor (ECF subfamily)